MKPVGRVFLVGVLLGAVACPAPGGNPERNDAGVVARRDSGVVVDGGVFVDAGPPGADAGYPQAATVPIDELARLLPKDEDGNPILMEVGGQKLTLGEARHDAISAAAACRDITASCFARVRDLDRCVASVPRCATQEPWNEAPCCADACVVAYQEQRGLGASDLDASDAVFASTHECFPGLQALIRASGGRPRLMPRRSAP